MVLAKVTGTVVATIKHPSFEGRKTYVVQPITPDGKPEGESFLCFDDVQSGVGDTVLVLREGTGARQVAGVGPGPIRSIIVGVVDEIDVPTAKGKK